MKKNKILLALLPALLVLAGCDSSVPVVNETPAASEDMAFVIQLPGNGRAVYYEASDATSYTVELTKSGSAVSTKTGVPGTTVRFEVTEEGIYTIKVSAYKDALLIAEGQKDAPISFGGGDVTVKVTLIPKEKGINLGIDIEWGSLEQNGTEGITELPEGTDGTLGPDGKYVTFGSFPQTVKAVDVTINESETKTAGAFTYYKGSDGEWYARQAENAYGNNYTYSDGSAVGQGGTSEKYFKVEPVKWCVLTDNYSGKKLLLAENILINCAYYDYYNVNRTVSGSTVYPNNYKESRVRAYLNGLSYEVKSSSSSTQTTSDSFLNKGFLQTAFSMEELALIAETEVNNSARSTNPDANAAQWNSGENQYVCENTTDKIFLLSEQEVTKSDYGFDVYNAYKGDGTYDESTRIRVTTDFARACGAYQASTAGFGGYWWLRSPLYNYDNCARYVYFNGNARDDDYVRDSNVGVVPALCVN